MTEKTWHVVHTLARSEWLAHTHLRRQGYETLYLHFTGTVCHARRKIGVLKPLFPRYLFVAVEPGQGLYAVNNTAGVASVLAGVDGPAEIAASEIDTLRRRSDEHGKVDAPRFKPQPPRFAPGECVRVIDGPLRSYNGIVDVDNAGEVDVWVQAFGGVIKMKLPSEALKSRHPQGGNRPKATPCNANSLAK